MNIEFALDGKVRDKPVADDYLSALDEVLKATDPRLGARIVSAGQAPKGSGGKRTGSTRHDVDHTGHSHTSDLVLTLDGKEIRPGDDKELYAKFLRNAAPKFPGIGHYDWGVHIGDGSAAMWGPDKTSKSVDPIFAKAISEGRSGTSMPAPTRKKVSDPAVLAKLNGATKRKKVTDPNVLAKLNGGAEKPAIEPKTNQPAGVPEFKPVGVEGYNPQTGEVENTGAVDKIGAFLTSAIEGVPIAGPTLKKAATGTAAGIVSTAEGKDFNEVYDDMAANSADLEKDNPNTATVGYLTGAVAPMIPLGATALGGRALGVTGNSLGGRVLASGASNMLIAGADTAARGGSIGDVAKSGGVGGVIGLAIPAAGAAVNSVGRAVGEYAGPRLNALTRPAQEAERRVGNAMTRDATAAPLLNQADEASAAVNQQNLLNVDRGGETTRALARSAANADPEARSLIQRTADDRFTSQGQRAQSFIQRLMGGATDDIALQEQLQTGARAANRPAYRRAYEEGSDLVRTPELERLMGSPAVVTAMRNAIRSGRDRATSEGMGVFNPAISITDDGRVVFNRANNAGGSTFPDLQFWDYTKRELDDMANAAARSGRNGEAATARNLARTLREELDRVVPSYREARAGAAAFFGAEDALTAGRQFVTQNRTLGETGRALGRMSRPERASFAVGFASELRDAIAQSGDRTNVIAKIFGSQQSREKIRMALGQQAYREFEQFVRVENSMDLLRGAMGNSTTARQLMEMGLAGGTVGTGTALFTGDWKSGVGAALVTGLVRRQMGRANDRVTRRVAELLLSDDPAALQQAVRMATNNPQASRAVEAIEAAISSALKGLGNSANRPERQPLEITVTKPNGVEAAQ